MSSFDVVQFFPNGTAQYLEMPHSNNSRGGALFWMETRTYIEVRLSVRLGCVCVTHKSPKATAQFSLGEPQEQLAEMETGEISLICNNCAVITT